MKIQLNSRSAAYTFDAQAGERILHAGLGRSVGLPYECGSGTCGTCRARLLKGEIDDAWPEAPGRKYLKRPDEFLMCQCCARGDLSLEVASAVQPLHADVYTPSALSGVVARARRLTHDVMELQVETDTPVAFDAGQFMLVQAPSVPGYRGWSMVNHERQTTRLTFIVKRKPGGGLSEFLFTSEPEGTPLQLFGPLGAATFSPALARNIVCIAGGSGVAGMLAILERAARDDYFTQFDGDLYFGVRTMTDAFYLDELSRLRERCGERLRITVALSEAALPEQGAHPLLAFDTGFVHDAAARGMQGRLQGVRAYLAGPPPAVDASVRMLLMSRVSTDNIRYDKFS